MITRAEVERCSAATAFRPEVVEKVLHLVGILRRLGDHELSASMWVLKGGTALNLFHLPLPRLSVDIDLNFVGTLELEGLAAARSSFERALASCCEREGCAVRRAPGEHAGGKFRLQFASVLGGTQKLEVDVSYVARLPLLGTERRRPVFPPDADSVVETLTLEELAAGKFAALLSRSAARDLFDAVSLLEFAPDLAHRPGFRLAFVCYAASSRQDFRKVRAEVQLPDRARIERELMLLLRAGTEAGTPTAEQLMRRFSETVAPAIREVLGWSPGERRFLERLLQHGEIEPEHLTDDSELRRRVSLQPMLRWKQLHVRNHLKLGEEPASYLV